MSHDKGHRELKITKTNHTELRDIFFLSIVPYCGKGILCPTPSF
jgi:hypothetical protein